MRIGDCLQDQFARRYGKDILWVGLSGPRADVCLSGRLRVECSNLADLLGLLEVSSMVYIRGSHRLAEVSLFSKTTDGVKC